VTSQLQIVILSRDRPQYLKETIDSALSQTGAKISYEVIISDNSEKNEVNDLIQKNYLTNSQIKYIRRWPTLTSQEHFHKVIKEFSSEFAVIFHDDDILHQDYLKYTFPLILNELTSAVGCNAIIFNKEINDGFKKMHEFNSIKKFASKKDFLMQYLIGNGGIAPFPGYIYKTKHLKQVSFEGLPSGKHADAVILSSLIEFGQIVWHSEVLMYYRVHTRSDSSTEAIPDRLSLLRYMYSQGISKSSKSVFLYKYLFWFNWLKQQSFSIQKLNHWRYAIALKFIMFGSIKVIGSKHFWKSIIKKLR
jgi:cellulose synthase/poly-beta-1,6-N-acetylglucosamine synthase-like glycosyltransferase